nr:MAG TPA: hypothetical protein [Caudoviricetes sp.]
MEEVNKKLIDNLLKQSEILLEKTILLSDDIKTEAGKDTRERLKNGDAEDRKEIMDELIKESEQIIKNSGQVLNNIIQIQELNK